MTIGLEIIYAKPDTAGGGHPTWTRSLAKKLREQHWVRAARVARPMGAQETSPFVLSFPLTHKFLKRRTDEPGDGFRYVSSAGGRGIEWIEVTEVFEGVHPRDIESFMRLENGGDPAGFDRDAFLSSLRMGIPSPGQQRSAADKVLAAVVRKLCKASYEGLWRTHGYGTLVVGMPLWFAVGPMNPLHPENASYDFTTRLQLGLSAQKGRLDQWSCPFWRVVVAWNLSQECLQEWDVNVRRDLYDDPTTYTVLGTAAASACGSFRFAQNALEAVVECGASSVASPVPLESRVKREFASG